MLLRTAEFGVASPNLGSKISDISSDCYSLHVWVIPGQNTRFLNLP